MAKKYGIGYTIFEYHNGIRMPVANFKAVPGNVADAMRVLNKRLKTIKNDRVLGMLIMASFIYGLTIRIVLAV